MTHTLTWKNGTQDIDTEEEAREAVRTMPGIVRHHAPSGSTVTFRDGRELGGIEATEANLGVSGGPVRLAVRVVRIVRSSEAVGQAGRCCGGVTKRGLRSRPQAGKSEVSAGFESVPPT